MATVQDILKQLQSSGSKTTTTDFSTAYQAANQKAPTQDELLQFVNERSAAKQQTVRPVTPAPTMITDTAKTAAPKTDEQIQQDLIAKGLKSKYGDSITPEQINYLAKLKVTGAANTDTSALEEAQKKQAQALADEVAKRQREYYDKQAELEQKTQERLKAYQDSLNASATRDINLARETAKENTATTERLLGSRGNLTSSVGVARINDIDKALQDQAAAINARKDAEYKLKQAELEGADAGTLRSLGDTLQKYKDAEFEFNTQAALDLTNAKLEAQKQGDTARQAMIQSALDNLSLESVKSKANAQLTKEIADGYIYDEMGQRIKDAEGNLITYEVASDIDKLMEVSAGASIYDPRTGQFVATAPKTSAARTSSGVVSSGYSGAPVLSSGGEIDTSKLSATAKLVYDNPNLLANYTPTKKGQILDELAKSGVDMKNFGLEKVGAAQRDTIAQYDDLSRQGKTAETILTELNLNTGPIASRVKEAGALFGGSPEFTQYRSVIDNMSSALLKLRSGAAVTPQEFSRIAGFIPDKNDDEKTALRKIKSFYEEMDTAKANYIKRATETSQQLVDSVSKTGTSDPLNLRD